MPTYIFSIILLGYLLEVSKMSIDVKLFFYVFSLQDSNGTERAVVNTVNGLALRGYNIEVISLLKQSRCCDFDIDPNVKLSSFNLDDSYGKFFVYAMFAWRLLFFYSQNSSIKCHHFGSLVYINLILIVMGFLYRSNACVSVCEHVPYKHPHVLVRALRKIIYKFADSVICLNIAEQRLFHRAGIESTIIPNIVHNTGLTPVSGKVSEKKLLYVGRLSTEKGIDLLAQVANEFFKLPNATLYHLDVIGDGPLLDSFKKSVFSMGLSENVHILGRKNDVFKYYYSSDFLLMTSRYESFGMVIVESMLCGTPVISFNVESGPACLIKHGYNGLLIDAFDCVLYARSLHECLMSNSKSLDSLSDHCLSIAADFTEEKIIPHWICLINNGLNR